MFDPDYDLLLDLAAAGSISAAARARGASVASVSKRLARLEQRLGTQLAHRTTRRFALTPAGEELVETLLPMRAGLAKFEDRLGGRGSGVSGPLRLTAPTSYGRMHVLPLLPAFIAACPGIDLTIDLSDQYVDLLAGAYDIAIRIGARIGPGLVGHRLGTSERILCAAPGYLARFGAPATIADLARHRLLAADGQLPWQLEGPDGPLRHAGASHVRTNSSEVVRELTIGGCGIALRSLWDVDGELASGALCRVLPHYRGSQDVGIYAVHAPAPVVPPRLAALVAHLQAHLTPDR